jgi:Flp pilus assembly protein TadG
MRRNFISHGNRRERGQTMVLVAVSIVSLLAMAALAIDVVTLYVARTEIQGAADAAALAGAKAIADSGLTSMGSTDGNFAAAQTLAQSMAQSAVAAVLASPNNQVAGVALAATPTYNFAANVNGAINNPRITVSLTRTGLPTFFAHIWGRTAVTVSSSATAEAYNPSNMANNTPISPKGVKPWLVANADPYSPNVPATGFITDLTTGSVEPGAIGEEFWLNADCPTTGGFGGFGPSRCGFALAPSNPPGVVTTNPRLHPYEVQYLPEEVTANAANVCSAGCAAGSDYQNSIQCADMNPYQCGSANGTNAQWDMVDRINPNGPNFTRQDTRDAVECLIHATATGPANGQDTISLGTWPNGPMQISASGSANLLSTSSSIVTIPIIDVTKPILGTGAVTVIGFMQAFVEQIDNSNNIQVRVMNVSGCSSAPNASPTITGGNSSSPVPVRLITPP